MPRPRLYDDEERKRRHNEANRRYIDKDRVEFNQRKNKRRRDQNAAKLEAKRRWERENPDRVAATRALSKIKRDRRQLERHLDWHYDFKLEDYEALLVAQGYRCAICGTERGNGRGHRLNVDHDHGTGMIRGLLCSKCNSAIGYFADSPKRLRKAAAYLENWRGKTCPDSKRGFQPLLGCLSEKGSAVRRPQSVDTSQPVERVS